jgi:DNA-binding PucR family transcriptional regulator
LVTPTSPLHEELVELALSGRGWPALLERLAAAAGREVRLIGVHGPVLVAAPKEVFSSVDPSVVAGFGESDDPAPITCADGWTGEAIALRAGRRHVGLLAMEAPISQEQQAMLLAARVPVCIEAVRRDAEAATRAESASRLIDEVRFGLLREPEDMSRLAERFGLVLDKPHFATVFSYDGANQRTWHTALTWVEMPVRQEKTMGWTILPADERELTRIRTRLQGMVGDDAPVLAATGSVVQDVHDTVRSFFEAEATMAVLRRRAPQVALQFSSLGVAGLLLSVPRDRIRAFVAHQLGPILDREDLLETLTAWLDTNGSRVAVAHRLDIHRNSVGYRMGKIRDLLGADPVDASASLQVQAALAAREVLAVLDELHESERGTPVNPITR